MNDTFTQRNEQESLKFLIDAQPKKEQSKNISIERLNNPDMMYLPNGKLNAPYLFQMGEKLEKAQDHAHAKTIYQAILKSHDFSAAALFRLGRCYEAEKNVHEACNYYQQSLSYLPLLEAMSRLAAIHIQLGRDEKAADILERALHLKDLTHTTQYELHKSLGQCFFRLNKKSAAKASFEKALSVNPQSEAAATSMGAIYLQEGRNLDAKSFYEKALSINPLNTEALTGAGCAYLALGDKALAHDAFEKSLQIAIHNPKAIFYIVTCAYDLKKYSAAEKLLDLYMQQTQPNPHLFYALAGLQFHLGKYSQSARSVTKVLTLEPDHVGALELRSLLEKRSYVC